jgi:hypothetical protein
VRGALNAAVPRLFHFSDDSSIDEFVPRPVRTPAMRPAGREWLNGPLVWAIDDWHQPMYLFPRDCPRILLWRTASTVPEEAERYFRDSSARILAYVEQHWVEALAAATLHRYELPEDTFVSLDDAGMWVSRSTVRPTERVAVHDLPRALREAGVELRPLPELTPLKGVWSSTLHASGIRLRNASRWSEG